MHVYGGNNYLSIILFLCVNSCESYLHAPSFCVHLYSSMISLCPNLERRLESLRHYTSNALLDSMVYLAIQE
ncbi:hypothetical protein KP509_1Z324000 [Ceratopteris richardii]|nr:hypothetical protein KP509_1Z324000 [Ceratopteris richardii]